MPRKEAPAVTEPPSPTPSKNGHGARVNTLPSVLDRKRQAPATSDEQAPDMGFSRPHKSANDDSMISMEEFEAIREILHPGRDANELDARTDLNTLQIVHFSRARIMAKRFGLPYLNAYVTNLQRMSLSKQRKSRKELVSAIQGAAQGSEEGTMSRMLGKLGG